MSDMSGLLSCNYGTTSLQVETMGVDEEPIVKQDQGRVGSKVTVKVTGYVDGTSAADFAGKVTAAYADLLISGRDLVVTGISGSTLLTLPAAACLEGGPHVKYTSKLGDVPLRMVFELSVVGNQPYDPDKKGKPIDAWKLDTQVKANLLRTITRTGDIQGASTPGFFLSTVLPAFQSAFPLPNWVMTWEYANSGDSQESKLSYSVVAQELAGPLPSTNADEAVDGDFSISTDRDEQFRLTTTFTWDVVLIGDPEGLLISLRQQAQVYAGKDKVIFKESAQSNWLQALRLRASFTVLKSAAGNPVMNYQQSFEIQRSAATFEVKTYAGADPFVVQKPTGVERLVQSGSATCEGVYLRAQSPRYNSHLEPPQIKYEDLGDGVQYRSSWTYVMYTSDRGNAIAAQPFETAAGTFHFMRREELDDQYMSPKTGGT